MRVVVAVAGSTALYYLLRALGAGVYASLALAALLSAAPSIRDLASGRRPDGLSGYLTVMMVGSVLVALLPGSTRLLLARDALLTGVTGVWFVVSARSDRPLAYLLSQPLLQGRLRWPSHWDLLWDDSPAFRRMWRVSSVLHGAGALLDAAARVVMAFVLPPDAVPGLSLVLYAATSTVLVVGSNAYYVLCGVHDPRSPLRRALGPARQPGQPGGAA